MKKKYTLNSLYKEVDYLLGRYLGEVKELYLIEITVSVDQQLDCSLKIEFIVRLNLTKVSGKHESFFAYANTPQMVLRNLETKLIEKAQVFDDLPF